MMSEWAMLIKDLGMGGGVLAGVVIAVKALRNGRACPAEPVLAAHHDDLAKAKVVHEGLIEAVNRNTQASERLTNVLVEVLVKEEKK